MIAENGTGTFMVGQGDYRWGNGGFKKAGDPVLFAKIGSASQTYIVPGPVLHLPEKWAHIAIVRTSNTFTLYLNGNFLSPPINYNGPAPVGNLRLGRRTDGGKIGVMGSNYVGQFYGFVDDVAVFNRTLSWTEINNLRNSVLTGNEPGLVAGFRFGFGDEANTSLHPKLRRNATEVWPAFRAGVEYPRDDLDDAKRLPLPAEVVELTLPFKPFQAWKVIQGMDVFNGSHNGTAAFSLDFNRGDFLDSAGEPLYAVADGTITLIRDQFYCDPLLFPTGSNAVVLHMAPDEFAVYHHLQRHSARNALFDDPDADCPGLPGTCLPQVLQGHQIGNCGSTGLKGCSSAHTHISVRDDSVSHPFAFSNYEVSDDGKGWYHVKRGIPKQGEWVRRLPTSIDEIGPAIPSAPLEPPDPSEPPGPEPFGRSVPPMAPVVLPAPQ